MMISRTSKCTAATARTLPKDFGTKENPTLRELIKTAAGGALAQANVPAAAIGRAYVGNFAGELFSQQGHL